MAEKDQDYRKVGGTADPKENPPADEPGRNPDETRQGGWAGQVSQEGQPAKKQRPETGAGSPGWKDDGPSTGGG